VIVFLLLATIIDLLLAALLIGVSGFIFGAHEGMAGESTAVLMWSFGILMCLGCPIAGFILRAKRQPGTGIIVSWLPPLGALFVAFFPYHPY
jgi:hypothetical protein